MTSVWFLYLIVVGIQEAVVSWDSCTLCLPVRSVTSHALPHPV